MLSICHTPFSWLSYQQASNQWLSVANVVPNECGETTQSIATILCILNTAIPTPLLVTNQAPILVTNQAPILVTNQAPILVTNQALVLSPAFLPIPNRLVEKIKVGHFIEMKELLGDNIALLQRLQEVQGAPNLSGLYPLTVPNFGRSHHLSPGFPVCCRD